MNNVINKQNLLSYLIQHLERQDFTEDMLHNQDTFNWTKGYKTGILSCLDLINKYIEKKNKQ